MADAVRVFIRSGCRKTKIRSLKWKFVDWANGCLRLRSHRPAPRSYNWRTMQSHCSSGAGTRRVLRASPGVLPALKGSNRFVGLNHIWTRVKARADAILERRIMELGGDLREARSLANVRLHDSRLSFASFAIADGASLFMVGKVLGDNQARTTGIYAHLSDHPLRQLANRTASRLSAAMRFYTMTPYVVTIFTGLAVAIGAALFRWPIWPTSRTRARCSPFS